MWVMPPQPSTPNRFQKFLSDALRRQIRVQFRDCEVRGILTHYDDSCLVLRQLGDHGRPDVEVAVVLLHVTAITAVVEVPQ